MSIGSRRGHRTTREELTAILADHARWLDDPATGKRADFRYANLQGANLGYADLWGADLLGADLRGANLKGAYLRYANLFEATLPEGWRWCRFGPYGPRRRPLDGIVGPDQRLTITAGCITGTPDVVRSALTDERLPVWVKELGEAKARRELARVLGYIDQAVAYLTEPEP